MTRDLKDKSLEEFDLYIHGCLMLQVDSIREKGFIKQSKYQSLANCKNVETILKLKEDIMEIGDFVKDCPMGKSDVYYKGCL